MFIKKNLSSSRYSPLYPAATWGTHGLFWIVNLVFYYFFMVQVPLSGDEFFFSPKGLALKDYLLGQSDKFPDLIDNGWFLPGSIFLSTVTHFISSKLSEQRLILGLVNLGLSTFIFLRLEKLGFKKVSFLFYAVSLMPIMMAWNFVLWGESIASKLLIIAATIVSGEPFKSTKKSVVYASYPLVGLLSVIAVYFRPYVLYAVFNFFYNRRDSASRCQELSTN